MSNYARLDTGNGATCMSCDAPCTGACTRGLDICSNLITAHLLLMIACPGELVDLKPAALETAQ